MGAAGMRMRTLVQGMPRGGVFIMRQAQVSGEPEWTTVLYAVSPAVAAADRAPWYGHRFSPECPLAFLGLEILAREI